MERQFLIRGHRLYRYRDYLQEGLLFLAGKGGSDQDTNDVCETMVSVILTTHKQWYIDEVLGTSPEELNQYLADLGDVLNRFLTLPDDYPVRIFLGSQDLYRDEACKICATEASHCQVSGSPKRNRMYSTDGWAISRFYGFEAPNEFDTTLGEVRKVLVEDILSERRAVSAGKPSI